MSLLKIMNRIHPSFRTALITGISRGLGRAIAEELLGCGVAVYGTCRDPSLLDEDAGLLGVRRLPLDLSTPVGLEHFVENHTALLSQLDLLINNAGEGLFGFFEELPPPAIEAQIHLLLNAPMRLCQAVLPHMKTRGSGTIVNVSSMAGRFPMPAFAPYCAAKGGLSTFSRGLMLECAGTGVTVIDLQPGDLRTDFNAKTRQVRQTTSARAEKLWQRQIHLLEQAPPPDKSAKILMRKLRHPRSQTIKTGSWIQTLGAPLLSTLLPERWMRTILRQHFRLSKGR